jgi:hypothetical protein
MIREKKEKQAQKTHNTRFRLYKVDNKQIHLYKINNKVYLRKDVNDLRSTREVSGILVIFYLLIRMVIICVLSLYKIQ